MPDELPVYHYTAKMGGCFTEAIKAVLYAVYPGIETTIYGHILTGERTCKSPSRLP